MNFHAPTPLPPPYSIEDSRPREIDLRGLRLVLLRRLPLLLTVFVLVAGVVFAIGLLQPRMYLATASIMINPAREQIVDPEQSIRSQTPNSAAVDSEMEVLRASWLARRVVEMLKLETDADWNGASQPGLLGQILSGFGLAEQGEQRAGGGDETENAVRTLANAVTVKRRGLSNVVDVSVEAHNPDEAAQAANGWVDAYLESTRATQLRSGERASGWLEQRLSELRQDLQAKEAAADAYRSETGLLSAEGHPLTESRLSGVQEAVTAARADLAEKEARYRQAQALIRSGGQGETMDEALNSDVIGALRGQEAELSRRQADYETTLGPRHPFVIQGQAELTDLRARIVAETSRIAEQLRNDVEISRTRLATLQGDLNSVSGQLVNDNEAQVRLGQLEREAAAARTVYESFLQRYHEVSGQGELPDSNASVVSRAFPPQTPSSPRLVLVAAAALLAGLVAALIACFAAQAFNDAIVSADDVEPRIGVPALASIPMIDARALRLLAPTDRHPPGYLVEKPHSPLAEAFRVLRAGVLRTRRDRPSTVVAVTSALPGEGKTSCSLSLARIAAMSGQSVLVVDGDLRRRSINDFLDIAPRSGLFQVLLGEKTWQDVIGVDEASGAHVLPLAASGSIARDIFETPAMRALISELRSAYELIILDAAPVLVCADARTLSEHADTTIVVARWAKTSIRATASAVMQLHRADAHVAGVALNYVDPRVPGWGSYADSLYYDRARYNYDTV